MNDMQATEAGLKGVAGGKKEGGMGREGGEVITEQQI